MWLTQPWPRFLPRITHGPAGSWSPGILLAPHCSGFCWVFFFSKQNWLGFGRLHLQRCTAGGRPERSRSWKWLLWGGCRTGRAWGIPRRLGDQISTLCAPLRARGRALHRGPTGICRAVPGACPRSISEQKPSISSVCRVWGWGLCLLAGLGDRCTQQEQAGGCHGIPEHRAGGLGPESHHAQPQPGAEKNAIWLGRAVGRGIRAARWHGGLDFRAGPHPAHPPPPGAAGQGWSWGRSGRCCQPGSSQPANNV